MDLAPIVLFVYNRPWHTEQTLNALTQNDLADLSTLYIFSDGPKHLGLDDDLKKIAQVRKIIRKRSWCKDVIIIESQHNKGLTDSIIEGITDVINRHEKVIVLEDDLVTSKGFLKFMNKALNIYQDELKVMQISGYIYGTPKCAMNQTTHFLRILGCNGWATWKRAWDLYEHDVQMHIEKIAVSKRYIKKFDIEGHATWFKQLLRNSDKTISSWAVRWYASWWLSGGFNLFPQRSLLTNIGHDGTGVHSPASFYNGETTEYLDVTKIPIIENKKLRKEIDLIWRDGLQISRCNRKTFRRVIKKTMSFLGIGYTKRIFRKILRFVYPELVIFENKNIDWSGLIPSIKDSVLSVNAKLYAPYHIRECQIGDYTYIARNCWISYTSIGKFCSIGPNLVCGWGVHPVDGISTHPMFYSTMKQNGMTLSTHNKVQERKPIKIGNDVFIGMNVTILDNVTIGDGAVIGAGAVVSKDIPPYAIAVGNPIHILKYRFDEETIKKLLELKWWDWPAKNLIQVEKLIFDVDQFLRDHSENPIYITMETSDQPIY